MQTALAALGYALVLSGVINADTRILLQTFQRGHGFAATGALTPDTVHALWAAAARRVAERR